MNVYYGTNERNACKRNCLVEMIRVFVCNLITACVESPNGDFLEDGMCEIICFLLEKV